MFIAAVAATGLIACKKDKKPTVTNPPPVNQEELITTFRIEFTDINGVQPPVTAQFADIDGPGGNAPSAFDTIRLQSGTTYNATITLLNESVTPAENISDEVQEEGEDHLFCFDPVAALNLAITRMDSDGTHGIGLATQWVAGAASAGDITIRLKHQPGVKDGTCGPGETDIELTFKVEIQ